MQNNLVSVIIPVYNSASFLGECLDSVLNQTHSCLEVICIDDGSTDHSLEVLNQYKDKDPRVQIISTENGGVSKARNLGLKLAKGRYTCFIDSDDKIDETTLRVCLSLFSVHDIQAVYYNMMFFYPDGRKEPCFGGELYKPRNTVLNTRQHDICANFTNAAPCVFLTSVLKQQGIEFPEGMLYEDWVFMIRFTCAVQRIFWLDEPFYQYRKEFGNSITTIVDKRCLDLFDAYVLACQSIEAANLSGLYAFITDAKIINEGIGFLKARLVQKGEPQLVQIFALKLQSILQSFSLTYYQCLMPLIRDLDTANIIRSQNYHQAAKKTYYRRQYRRQKALNKLQKHKVLFLNPLLALLVWLTRPMRIIFYSLKLLFL